MAATAAAAQVTTGYTYTEVAPSQASSELVFGFAAYKICQIKNFLFMAVYAIASIAFVLFAIRALFTKFEMKSFLPIIGSLFIVATADLLVSFFTSEAFFCPTVFSSF